VQQAERARGRTGTKTSTGTIEEIPALSHSSVNETATYRVCPAGDDFGRHRLVVCEAALHAEVPVPVTRSRSAWRGLAVKNIPSAARRRPVQKGRYLPLLRAVRAGVEVAHVYRTPEASRGPKLCTDAGDLLVALHPAGTTRCSRSTTAISGDDSKTKRPGRVSTQRPQRMQRPRSSATSPRSLRSHRSGTEKKVPSRDRPTSVARA